MNPLIPDTTPTSLLIPLNQLSNYCNRLIISINNVGIDQKSRVLQEQTLWSEVKKIKSTSDNSVFLYLTGFYLTVLFQISQSTEKIDVFHYNVLIRLGDLSRYMQNYDVAEYYYCSARNLYPCYGHAYNQLGLLTKPTNYYKCCYYYARAARASDKPLVTIADSNIKMAVKKYGSELLRTVMYLDTEKDVQINQNNNIDLPRSSFEWFYVIVLAIYADNITPVANVFLDYLNDNFSTQTSTITHDNCKQTITTCSLDSYLLLASFDILLDWLKFGSQSNELKGKLATQIHQIRLSLQKVLMSCDITQQNKRRSQRNQALSLCTNNPRSYHNNYCDELNTIASLKNLNKTFSTHSDQSTLNDSSNAASYDTSTTSNNNITYDALPHDYILSGFKPLDVVHKNVSFKSRDNRTKAMFDQDTMDLTSTEKDANAFINKEQLTQIITRLKDKMDQIGVIEMKKPRATRNIALQSILCKLGRED